MFDIAYSLIEVITAFILGAGLSFACCAIWAMYAMGYFDNHSKVDIDEHEEGLDHEGLSENIEETKDSGANEGQAKH